MRLPALALWLSLTVPISAAGQSFTFDPGVGEEGMARAPAGSETEPSLTPEAAPLPTPVIPPGGPVRFTWLPGGAGKSFRFIPPAPAMFVDASGKVSLVPALFPAGVHFALAPEGARFFHGRFSGAFTVYRVGSLWLALAEAYTLYSATLRDGVLFVLARDAAGNFVELTSAHFAVADRDGVMLAPRRVEAETIGVSILADRSQSMDGFNAALGAALSALADSLPAGMTCALYEFGDDSIRRLARPGKVACRTVLSRYRPSSPYGNTPVFRAMETAYRELDEVPGIGALIILSDGRPTDTPTADLAAQASQVPTLVLWMGNHTVDYLAGYSTAHAISLSASKEEIIDFLRGAALAAMGHQAFRLQP